MKKATIARFVMGMAAIFAAGCSAEVGAPEATGASQEALTVSSTLTSLPSSAARDFAGGCTIHDGLTYGGVTHNADYVLMAGGNSTTGSTTATRDWYLLDPASGGTYLLNNQFGAAGDEVSNAPMIQVPSDSGSCLLVGGLKNNVGKDKVWKFSLAVVSNALSVTVAQAGKLTVARGDVKLAQCGTDVIAVGGRDGTTPKARIDSWNGVNGTTVWNNTADLTEARYGFVLAPTAETNTKRFIAFGGHAPLANPTLTLEALTFSASGGFDCNSLASHPDLYASFTTGGSQVKPSARADLVGFEVSSAGTSPRVSQFKLIGGDTGSAVLRDQVNVEVTWNASPSITSSTITSNAIATGLRKMELVKLDTANTPNTFVIIGGEDHSATASTNVQKFASSTWTSATTALGSARIGHFATYVPSLTAAGSDYIVTGLGHSGATAYGSIELVQTP